MAKKTTKTTKTTTARAQIRITRAVYPSTCALTGNEIDKGNALGYMHRRVLDTPEGASLAQEILGGPFPSNDYGTPKRRIVFSHRTGAYRRLRAIAKEGNPLVEDTGKV